MNYFHCLHKFMATSKKRKKKEERASPACFFLLLTSIIPLSHSHRLAAFIRFLHHTVPPPQYCIWKISRTSSQCNNNPRKRQWHWGTAAGCGVLINRSTDFLEYFYKFLLRIYGCGLYVAVQCLETVQEPKVRLDKHMLFAVSPRARTSGHFHRGDD